MAVYRLQVGWQADSAFPRDQLIITPHFSVDNLEPEDPDGLCSDLADALMTWQGITLEVEVTAYEVGAAPNAPVGHAVRFTGENEASTDCRELACCLSFYAGENRPRTRGRLYLPSPIVARGATGAIRPGAGVINKVAALAPIFEGLGGANVDWVVYSRVLQEANSVTNWWVDNEWDIIRSRGLRPTTRTTGTTSEG